MSEKTNEPQATETTTAETKPSFSIKKTTICGLRVRSALRGGLGTAGNTQPQRDGIWGGG